MKSFAEAQDDRCLKNGNPGEKLEREFEATGQFEIFGGKGFFQ
jgi:hypothetical protein